MMLRRYSTKFNDRVWVSAKTRSQLADLPFMARFGSSVARTRGHKIRVISAQIEFLGGTPGEEMVLVPERHGPDGALDRVVVKLDATVVEEAAERRPARERIADGLR